VYGASAPARSEEAATSEWTKRATATATKERKECAERRARDRRYRSFDVKPLSLFDDHTVEKFYKIMLVFISLSVI
jgi:hypothetical protein